MRRPFLLLLATSVALGAASAPAPGTTADGGLLVASLAPETGDLAPILDAVRVPVELAVEEINAAGGVNGHDVTLVVGNEGSDPETARATVDRLASEGVDAIVGPVASSTTVAVLEEITEAGILTCSGSDSLAAVDDSDGLYFRTAPPSRLEGLALAELMLADGHRRVAVLKRRDDFGTDVGRALTQRLRRGGGRVISNIAYSPDASSFATQVERALAKEPDAIAILGFDVDGAAVVRELVAQGAPPPETAIYVPEAMRRATFATSVDPSDPSTIEGIKGTAPAATPYDVDSPFHETFAGTGVDPVHSSQFYDCTILTALAAVKAESNDPAEMKQAFTDNLRGDADCNTFAACAALLDDGASIHWRGASSNFDDFGSFEPNTGVYDAWTYDAAGVAVTGSPSEQILVP